MEIIERVPIDLEALADLLPQRGIPARKLSARDVSRWHVSNLLESSKMLLKGDCRYHVFEGAPSGIMSLGRIWEFCADVWLEEFAKRRRGHYHSDYNTEKDNILASLDGLMFLPDLSHELCVVTETKLRFTADDSIPESHLRQMMCYCAVVETCFVGYTVLRIGSRPPTAEAEFILAHFPHPQPAEVWRSIVKAKEYLEARGITPDGRQVEEGG